MWKMVQRVYKNQSLDGIYNMSYEKLSMTEKLAILDYLLPTEYELYVRNDELAAYLHRVKIFYTDNQNSHLKKLYDKSWHLLSAQ